MTTENKVSETVRADQLQPGDWIKTGRGGVGVALVLFASDADRGEVILVVKPDGLFTDSFPVTADHLYVRASEDEIAAAKGSARRKLIVSQLRRLASLIEDNPDLPLGKYPNITFPSDLDMGELDQVAQVVGVPVSDKYYGSRHRVVRFGSFEGFHAEWSGTLPDGDAEAIVAESTSESVPAAPKPSVPKRAAVKRSPAVDAPSK